MVMSTVKITDLDHCKKFPNGQMLQISLFLWSVFHSVAEMNFVKCKSDLVTTLSPNSPIMSNYTQNKIHGQ